MKSIYDHYMANTPITEDGQRKRGNTPQDSFWVGFDGGPARGEPTSNARLAWQAGRDTARAEKNRDRVYRHRAERRAKGLVSVSVWVKPENTKALQALAKKLQ